MLEEKLDKFIKNFPKTEKGTYFLVGFLVCLYIWITFSGSGWGLLKAGVLLILTFYILVLLTSVENKK